MKDRIREWLIAVAWLGALVALYEWHGGTSVGFLIILTGIFMLGGLVLQWFGAHDIEIKRTINPIRLTVGSDAEVEVHIEFRSILPLPWMSITDYFTEGSHSKLWFPGWRRSFTYKYYLQNLPRGMITFQVCHVEWGGLFRCFKNSYLLPCEEDIMVLPIPAAISREQGWSSHDIREGEQVTHQQQRPANVWGLDIRDYNVGDPLSRVHWKSSARRGRLQTRLPEAVEDHELCIILDHCPDNYKIISSIIGNNKEVVCELFEGAVSVAAGLLQNALEEGVQAELISGEGIQHTYTIAPAYQTTLAIIQPNGTKRVADLMVENTDHLLPRTRIVVITGSLHDELTRAVASLQRRGMKVEIYSVFPLLPTSNGNGADMEQTRQDVIANSLQRFGVRLRRLNVGSLDVRNEINGLSGKEMIHDDGSFTEWRNRYV